MQRSLIEGFLHSKDFSGCASGRRTRDSFDARLMWIWPFPDSSGIYRRTPTWRKAFLGTLGKIAFSLCVLTSTVPFNASAQSSKPDTIKGSAVNSHRNGQHDFDFEIGTWKTELKRLLRPLTGSDTWVEYEGTTVVRKVWDGRANLVELVAGGPSGHFEGLSLRLYNPESGQWSLNFANSRTGTLDLPAIGRFENGRGEFFNQDTFNGRAILVRFVISVISPDVCRFEQSFSDDGGKTWELNWIATDTRLKN